LRSGVGLTGGQNQAIKPSWTLADAWLRIERRKRIGLDLDASSGALARPVPAEQPSRRGKEPVGLGRAVENSHDLDLL
jgi:hypothetical protein